jgi:hypothetical protein
MYLYVFYYTVEGILINLIIVKIKLNTDRQQRWR